MHGARDGGTPACRPEVSERKGNPGCLACASCECSAGARRGVQAHHSGVHSVQQPASWALVIPYPYLYPWLYTLLHPGLALPFLPAGTGGLLKKPGTAALSLLDMFLGLRRWCRRALAGAGGAAGGAASARALALDARPEATRGQVQPKHL